VSNSWFNTCVRKYHLDFHTPDAIEVGRGFSPDEFGGPIAEAGFEAVIFFAKCHYGNSYYPTKVGHVHPRLVEDLVGGMVEGCRKHGLHPLAYYSTGFDGHAVKANPDWGVHPAPAETPDLEQGFIPVCLNSPYTERLVIPQIKEILSYGVDGFFFDMMTMFGPCYCPHCERLWRSESGRELPRGEEDPHWAEYARWRAEKGRLFVEKITTVIKKINPDAVIGCNWLYSTRQPIPIEPGLSCITMDINTRDYQCLGASREARYSGFRDIPLDVMICRGMYGWADWTQRPADMLKQEVATICALGGRPWIGDRVPPDGVMKHEGLRVLREINDFTRELEPFTLGAEPVRNIALLHGASSLYGEDRRHDASPEIDKRLGGIIGAHRWLAEAGEHFEIIDEIYLENILNEYSVLILPDQALLPEKHVDAIREFVHSGGSLMATFRTSLGSENPQAGAKFALADVFGTTFEALDDLGYGYILPRESQDDPILVHGNFCKVKATGADVLAASVIPWGTDLTRERFGWGFAPPGKDKAGPAILLNSFGKGKAIYVAADVFGSFGHRHTPALARLLTSLLRVLDANPLVAHDGGPQIEVAVTVKGKNTYVHLINQRNERVIAGWPTCDVVPELRDVTVRIRRAEAPKSVSLVPKGTKLDFRYEDGTVEVMIPVLKVHAAIEVA